MSESFRAKPCVHKLGPVIRLIAYRSYAAHTPPKKDVQPSPGPWLLSSRVRIASSTLVCIKHQSHLYITQRFRTNVNWRFSNGSWVLGILMDMHDVCTSLFVFFNLTSSYFPSNLLLCMPCSEKEILTTFVYFSVLSSHYFLIYFLLIFKKCAFFIPLKP